MSSWFSKLGKNLSLTSNKIKNVLSIKKYKPEDIDNLEETLIKSDLGVVHTELIITKLKKSKSDRKSIINDLFNLLIKPFEGIDSEIKFNPKLSPQVILFAGVNGSGKTTTIAKVAYMLKGKNINTTIAAADTFRAAAKEQLVKWGNKISVEVITGSAGQDPSSVVFQAHKIAKKKGEGVLLIDTAGRLHTKKELMEELKKIVRTINKNDPIAPHNVLLVLDSTIGQNTYTQVESFNNQIGITGLIMTKLDGSAKGGSLIGITEKFKIPIHLICIGEKIDDLMSFVPEQFVRALIGLKEGETE